MQFRQADDEAKEKWSFRGCEAGFVGLRWLWVCLPQCSRGLLNTEKPKSIFGFLFHTILPYNGEESVTSNRTLDHSFVQDSVHFLSHLQITFIKTGCQWPRCTRIYWLRCASRWSTESHVDMCVRSVCPCLVPSRTDGWVQDVWRHIQPHSVSFRLLNRKPTLL